MTTDELLADDVWILRKVAEQGYLGEGLRSIELGLGVGSCGVCMGHSPLSDGHDRGCAVWVRSKIKPLLAALAEAQARADEWETRAHEMGNKFSGAESQLAAIRKQVIHAIQNLTARLDGGADRTAGLDALSDLRKIDAALASGADTPTQPQDDERAQVHEWFQRHPDGTMATSRGHVSSAAEFDSLAGDDTEQQQR